MNFKLLHKRRTRTVNCHDGHCLPRRWRRERGSILILVIGILAVMTIMAITFAMLTRLEMGASQAQSDAVLAELAAKGGAAEEMQIIRLDDRRFDHFGEFWFWGVNSPFSYSDITFNNGVVIARYSINPNINEDPPGDANGDGAPGIKGVDDDGDGSIDEGDPRDDDEDGLVDEDPIGDLNNNGLPGGGSSADNGMYFDRDGDGKVDEEAPGDANGDGAPGYAGVDDDGDGLIDEGNVNDDDEDGFVDEDYVGRDIPIDDDGDGLFNEDPPGDENGDGFPGVAGEDDDGDGLIDEDSAGRVPGNPGYTNDLVNDDDEDGRADEDGDAEFPPISFGAITIRFAGAKFGANAHDDDGDSVLAEPAGMIMDEGGKINLNAHGNLSVDTNGDGIGDAHGTNMRWSSFEVSLERFFQAYGFTPAQSRIIATAIIKYRYGTDGAPGRIGVDDDNDNAILTSDGIDNDGDGAIDEANEGVDEPDEFDPTNPHGDDTPFRTIDEFKIALVNAGFNGVTANRIFNIVKEDITVSSFFHETIVDNRNDRIDNDRDGLIDETDGSEFGGQRPYVFSLNDWATDGIDNDGDGLIDEADENIDTWGTADGVDNDRDGNVDDPDELALGNTVIQRSAREVALISQQFVDRGIFPNTLSPGSLSMLSGLWYQWLTNLVDFRDADHIPTTIDLRGDGIDNDGDGMTDEADEIVMGTEGLHITEYMPMAVADLRQLPAPPVDFYEDDVFGLVDGNPNDAVDDPNIAWEYQGNGRWRQVGNPTNPIRNILRARLRLHIGINLPIALPPPGGGLTGNTLPRGSYIVRLVNFQVIGGGGPGLPPAAFVYVNNDNIPLGPSIGPIGPGGPQNIYIPQVVDIPHTDRADTNGVDDNGNGIIDEPAEANIINVGIVIDVGGRRNAQFRLDRIEFYPEYVEITNISTQPIDLNGYTLNVGGASFPIGANSAQVFDPSNPGTPMTTSVIPGASANGSFPIEYGNFILANNQAVYDGCWGDGSGVWGDAPGEDVPVFFASPVGAVPSALSIQTPGPGNPPPNIWLIDNGGNVVAGTSPTVNIDNISSPSTTLPGFVSVEKTDPAMTGSSAAWDRWQRPGWTGGILGLGGSQNDNDDFDNDGDNTVDEPNDRIESYTNSAYEFFFDYPAPGFTRTSTYPTPQEDVFGQPFDFNGDGIVDKPAYDVALIWDRPLPNAAWFGLVHAGLWQTVPLLSVPKNPNFPTTPDILDVTVTTRTLARININTASYPVLYACFGRATAANIYRARQGKGFLSIGPQMNDGLDNDLDSGTDELDGSELGLLDSIHLDSNGDGLIDAPNKLLWTYRTFPPGPSRSDDDGYGLLRDDCRDELDEEEEWIRRYANFITLRSNVFTIISRGRVIDTSLGNVLAERKIKMLVERARTPRGIRILDFQFLTDY